MHADQIINLDLQPIAAKSNQHLLHSPEQHLPAPQIPAPQQIQLNDMAGIFTERTRQIQNLYWQLGHIVNAPVKRFCQIKYMPFPNAVPDFYQALYGARLDCERDLHKQLIDYNEAAKVWMTVQVEYEPVKPLANKVPFVQYLRAAPTRNFRRDGTVSAIGNSYIYFLLIFTDRLR